MTVALTGVIEGIAQFFDGSICDAACVEWGCGVTSESRFCQGSSEVEQGTHKPLVASSSLAPGTNFGLEIIGFHPRPIIRCRERVL